MKEPIADRIREGRIPDVFMPVGGRQLAGDDRRPGAVAILQDLQQIPSLDLLQGDEGEIIQDENLHPRQLPEELGVRPIRPRQGERLEEAGHPPIQRAPCRHAWWARAQAREVFPVPVAPLIRMA